jgi:tetratricopeptide (TPR) repeat protein
MSAPAPLFVFCSVLMLLARPSLSATNELAGMLQKALFEEEANHNLSTAIQSYENLISQFDKDRSLAATAVFRLGECYRKQGKTNEANMQYERVLREFNDQTQIASASRDNLVALGRKPSTATSSNVASNLQEAANASPKRPLSKPNWICSRKCHGKRRELLCSRNILTRC